MATGSAGAPAPAPLAIAGATPTTPAGRGGRRPTGATVNPRSVADFEDIAGIPFVFARHPTHHDAHTHMNAIYSDAFVAPLWARCSFSISAGHRHPNRRLALATLREAVQHAITYNLVHELKITIGTQALHF